MNILYAILTPLALVAAFLLGRWTQRAAVAEAERRRDDTLTELADVRDRADDLETTLMTIAETRSQAGRKGAATRKANAEAAARDADIPDTLTLDDDLSFDDVRDGRVEEAA